MYFLLSNADWNECLDRDGEVDAFASASEDKLGEGRGSLDIIAFELDDFLIGTDSLIMVGKLIEPLIEVVRTQLSWMRQISVDDDLSGLVCALVVKFGASHLFVKLNYTRIVFSCLNPLLDCLLHLAVVGLSIVGQSIAMLANGVALVLENSGHFDLLNRIFKVLWQFDTIDADCWQVWYPRVRQIELNCG